MYRKGTLLMRKLVALPPPDGKTRKVVLPFFADLFKEKFWKEHHEILGLKSVQVYKGDISDGEVLLCPHSMEEGSSTKDLIGSEDSSNANNT